MSGAVYARFLGGPWHDQLRVIEEGHAPEFRVAVMGPLTVGGTRDDRPPTPADFRTAFYRRLGPVRAAPPVVYELLMYVGTL